VKVCLAEQPLQRQLLLRPIRRIAELRHLREAGRQMADRLLIGRTPDRSLAGCEPIAERTIGCYASEKWRASASGSRATRSGKRASREAAIRA
jgi:hypothetical protein